MNQPKKGKVRITKRNNEDKSERKVKSKFYEQIAKNESRGVFLAPGLEDGNYGYPFYYTKKEKKFVKEMARKNNQEPVSPHSLVY